MIAVYDILITQMGDVLSDPQAKQWDTLKKRSSDNGS